MNERLSESIVQRFRAFEKRNRGLFCPKFKKFKENLKFREEFSVLIRYMVEKGKISEPPSL